MGRARGEGPLVTLGEFFQEVIDDANESIERVRREGETLREIGRRARFGLHIMKHVAKKEIEIAASDVAERMAELVRGRRP
jgi:hypothetical protein